MLEFRATTQNFSPAILELDAAMRSGRLRHDGNPVLEWVIAHALRSGRALQGAGCEGSYGEICVARGLGA